ncbi:hypothetical protein BJV82DRAFT_71717 [Fennellomyces sp. T-0311]|nr:hypothetical protein BJV82DRAFT_71717 [Fennellomyces sp. T-0311]
MKREGYEIVGYCRKSPGDDLTQDRLRLIQNMAGRLRERSLVNSVFISFSCKSSQAISKRDNNVENKSKEILNKFADGSI